ncbi:peptidase M23 [Fodinicola acaciae]|uniref:peptidase M23 n=1 Tax=Fodinicola acaciae TaxID=2681555 RepID=UPI0013D5EF40|nr:peptidase M23 [Fodinicola acaciae]
MDNLTTGDGSSVGLYQQTASSYPNINRNDPVAATNAFLNEMIRVYPNNSWETAPIGDVCANVQRPAQQYRYRYALEAHDGTLIADAYWQGQVSTGHHLVVGSSADGRMEVFAGTGSGVWHAYQTAADGPWSDWENIGGPANAALAIAAVPDGRLELFALNSQAFWHTYQTAPSGSWASWESNFGGGGYDVAVGRNKSGRLEVVASNGGGVYHKYQNTDLSWSGWGSLTGPNGGGANGNAHLAAASSADGRIEIFAMNDQSFFHTYQTAADGGWANWESDFGGGGSYLAVGTNKSGRLEVAASNGGGIYHKYQNTDLSWSGWGSLVGPDGVGGNGNAKLATERSPDGRIELFAVNSQVFDHIYQTATDGNWSNWETNFGGGGSDVAVGHNKTGRLEVVASNGGGIYHKYQNTDLTWSSWSSLVGPNGTGAPGI